VAGAMEGCERQFPAFPFKPYPIQLRFMNAVYRALQKGGVAIVESPTGSFGSLSSIPSFSSRMRVVVYKFRFRIRSLFSTLWFRFLEFLNPVFQELGFAKGCIVRRFMKLTEPGLLTV
jgi:hypothetical protein